MDKIKVEIVVIVNHGGFNYSYEDKVEKSAAIEGYYPALVHVPFDDVCAGLARAALNKFYVNQLSKEEEENGSD